jgi:hypothetical protein
MIGTRHVTTAALALGAILLASTALQGASAQARAEGLSAGAGSQARPNLADPADTDDLEEAEPAGQAGPFVPGSNPDGGKRSRLTGQPGAGVPYPNPAALSSPTARQPAPYAAQRYTGGGTPPPPTAANKPSPRAPYAGNGDLPPSASKQPAPGTPATYGASAPAGVKTPPYKQAPYGGYADSNGYQGYGGYRGSYGGYQGGYQAEYPGAYGSHRHDCP